ANSYFLGKDGDIVYSKNNVCVHETREIPGNDDDVSHIPGYLTIHCLHDEHLGATLVLQWLPNKTLEKNPASIRCVSPRSRNKESRENGTTPHKPTTSAAVAESDEDESLSLITTTSIEDEGASRASTEICVEVNGDMITVSAAPQDRPTTLEENGFGGLGVPQINVIPNTPIDHRSMADYDGSPVPKDAQSDSSGATSGADDMSDKEDQAHNSSSCDESEADEKKAVAGTTVLEPYRQNYVAMLSTTPEQFAKDHNLMLESSTSDDPSVVALSKERVIFQQKSSNASLFSVNLGKMRSMRLFYSNPEYTSGQLVITSPDSQYKILHFHHGGLDKLAQLFEQWNADSPSPVPDRHLVVFHPEVSRDELDPEEGLYDGVGWDLWKSYMNKDGSIDDSFTIRKTVYFAAIEPSLRKEIWPFLLHMYPWNSTFEQREAIRNDLFLEYQNIKKKRMRKMNSGLKSMFLEIESSVWKDVVRTDRKTEYFAGDDNPNLEIMKYV
ncbi:Protein TBC-16, partial [Aphelenchoides avenae]